MTTEDVIVSLIPLRNGFVEIYYLSDEQEDDLYEHIERLYGGDRVSAVIGKPYKIKVSDISELALLGEITQYCDKHEIALR